MRKFSTYLYSLPLAILLASGAQSASAGESSWYVRGDGAFAFSRPHVATDSTVYHYWIYDVEADYSATVDEFFEDNWDDYSEPDEVSVNKKFNVRGAHYTAGIGKHITKHHRVQLDYTTLYIKKKDNDVGDSAKARLQGAVFSAYLGGEAHKYILPYIMGGAGYGKLKMKYDDPDNAVSVSLQKNTPIWQAGLGVLFPISNYIEIDAGYKFTFLNRKLSKIAADSYSNVTVEYDAEDFSYSAFLDEAVTDATFRLRPIHSFFVGLKFNIN